MLNIAEIESIIAENIRQNRVWESLIEDLKKAVCPRSNPRHKNLRVCESCHHIYCMECVGYSPCNCWNDE